jgi:pantetheine-phosphate adenylyltransferase
MTKDEYTFISSRLVKEISQLGGDVSTFVPHGVKRTLAHKFGAARLR